MISLAYSAFEWTAVIAGIVLVRERPKPVPVATIAALLVIGIPTLAQLTVDPGLLEALQRDRAAIGHGEVWRLATALVVQDGLIAGGVTNLIAMAVLGTLGEWVFGWRRWLAIVLPAALAGELWGLVVQPVGGGNSVAYFGIGAAVALVAARRRNVFGLLALAVGAVLLVIGDIHGGAALAGALLGLLLRPAEPDAAPVGRPGAGPRP